MPKTNSRTRDSFALLISITPVIEYKYLYTKPIIHYLGKVNRISTTDHLLGDLKFEF